MLNERDERYVRFLGRYFFASGYEREDIEQEARLGMLASPNHVRNGARCRVLDLVKTANRRAFVPMSPLDAENSDDFSADFGADPYDLVEHVLKREELRTVIAAARTRKQKVALGRLIRGESISEKWVDNALYAVRRRARVA